MKTKPSPFFLWLLAGLATGWISAFVTAPTLSGQTIAQGNNQHRLPWPVGKVGRVSRRGGAGHVNQVDFTLPDPHAVYVTKPGRVVFVKESSNQNCTIAPPNPCWQRANMVVIEHGPSEFSWYVHLAHNSVPVRVGSYVEPGTRIGTEGATGYTLPANARHLHFMLSTARGAWTDPNDPNRAPWPPEGTIVPVNFEEVQWADLAGGQQHRSRNASDPAVTSRGDGRIDLFAQGESNTVWFRPYNNGWGGWVNLGGIITSSPDAASWGSSHVDVYVRGLDNSIYYRRNLGGWSAWQSIGQPPGGATSSPAAVSRSNGTIDVFVRGADNALWRRAYSGSWGSWHSLGGVLTTAPDVSSWGSSHMDVFVRGLDNGMYVRRYLSGVWQPWVRLGGVVTADPGATSAGAGQSSFFVRGITKELWHRSYGGGQWGGWELLGGILTSGPDATRWTGGRLHVFLRGLDDRIYYRRRSGGAWTPWAAVSPPPY